jgi:hypothetical protein
MKTIANKMTSPIRHDAVDTRDVIARSPQVRKKSGN